MFKRLGAVLLAIVLIGCVIYLGILSEQDSKFVAWFGIACAILAPVALNLLTYALNGSDGEVIQRLARVPEIGRMIEDAKTQEDKIRLLESERLRLAEIIKLESRRLAVRDRIESLSLDAIRITKEFESLEQESRDLGDEIADSAVSEEIRQLSERLRARERGDFVITIGGRTYRIDREIVATFLPMGGSDLLLAGLRMYERRKAKGNKK